MKKTLLLISILVVFISIAMGVNAHSGRTDENGGHTDHSTGEYHYHHGYPAHDHYDIDGDGDKDCPYDFKDKTNQSNRSSKSTFDYETVITIGIAVLLVGFWIAPIFFKK